MDKARYVLALVTLVSIPPAVGLWFLIHPFGKLWRRLGPLPTFGVLGLFTLILMAGAFRWRRSLLGPDLGTSYGTMALAVLAIGAGSGIALRRRRYLSYSTLSGLPEITARRYPGILLTEGIYGRIRHPRYVEVVFWVLGYALFSNYLGVYVLLLLVPPALYLVVILEERELEERFGQAWRDYAARVPRFVPRWVTTGSSAPPGPRTELGGGEGGTRTDPGGGEEIS